MHFTAFNGKTCKSQFYFGEVLAVSPLFCDKKRQHVKGHSISTKDKMRLSQVWSLKLLRRTRLVASSLQSSPNESIRVKVEVVFSHPLEDSSRRCDHMTHFIKRLRSRKLLWIVDNGASYLWKCYKVAGATMMPEQSVLCFVFSVFLQLCGQSLKKKINCIIIFVFN